MHACKGGRGKERIERSESLHRTETERGRETEERGRENDMYVFLSKKDCL